jgi:hypothetical protein
VARTSGGEDENNCDEEKGIGEVVGELRGKARRREHGGAERTEVARRREISLNAEVSEGAGMGEWGDRDQTEEEKRRVMEQQRGRAP